MLFCKPVISSVRWQTLISFPARLFELIHVVKRKFISVNAENTKIIIIYIFTIENKISTAMNKNLWRIGEPKSSRKFLIS